MGGIALAQLLGADQLLAGAPGGPSIAGSNLSRSLHHPAKAKRVIQLFMNGGCSQADTFDYKPALIKLNGQTFSPTTGQRVEAATSLPGPLMQSPWEWKQHGQCGRWVTNVFPQMTTCVDDMAFLMAMTTPTSEHSSGVYGQTTGFVTPGFPCAGAWISYALGSLSDNLPAFVVLPDARGLPYNAKNTFGPGFLPVSHAGMLIKPASPDPVADLFPPRSATYITPQSDAEGLAVLGQLNRLHQSENRGDSRLDARIASYELAARMQLSAPEALDLSRETEATRRMYGLDTLNALTKDFARNCLLGRRLLERGVRFVQIFSGMDGATGNWDNHTNVKEDLLTMANMVDQPTVALLNDLKQRGMLDDTLVIFTTEFGRMPFSQAGVGRDHNGGTFVTWLAGGGVRGGTSYGQSDEVSWKAAENVTTRHDLHATVLHLLGIDHEKLTFRHNGVDRRLTDVHGEVVKDILA